MINENYFDLLFDPGVLEIANIRTIISALAGN
jgi:hypothetical protein